MGEVWWGKGDMVGMRKFIAMASFKPVFRLLPPQWSNSLVSTCTCSLFTKETFTNNFYYSSVYIVDTRVNMIF